MKSLYQTNYAWLYIVVQVLIETLVALGAQIRWSACNIYSTQVNLSAVYVNCQLPSC